MTHNGRQILAWSVAFIMIAISCTFFFGLLLPTVHQCWRLRNGITADATVLSVAYHGGKYAWADAHFSYSYNGKSYTSDNVSIWGGSADFYQTLDRAMKRRLPVPIHVDPLKPDFAAYDRSMHYGKFTAGILFIIVPLGLASHILHGLTRQRKQTG